MELLAEMHPSNVTTSWYSGADWWAHGSGSRSRFHTPIRVQR